MYHEIKEDSTASMHWFISVLSEPHFLHYLLLSSCNWMCGAFVGEPNMASADLTTDMDV